MDKNRYTKLLKAAAIILLAADIMLLTAFLPQRLEGSGRAAPEIPDLAGKYRENPDIIGWLQVDGTDIDYPVMRGEKYLYRDFSGGHDESGSLFVEDDWSFTDICTLVYGHNMWMYGTMFSQLHRFTDEEFFTDNRQITFYALNEDTMAVEKRTYRIICCARTSVDKWNYASCQYISSREELASFIQECRSRAALAEDPADGYEGAIILSTCSYRGEGKNGRLLVVGGLLNVKEQTKTN